MRKIPFGHRGETKCKQSKEGNTIPKALAPGQGPGEENSVRKLCYLLVQGPQEGRLLPQ